LVCFTNIIKSIYNQTIAKPAYGDFPLSLHFFYSDAGKPDFAMGVIPIRIFQDEESVPVAE